MKKKTWLVLLICVGLIALVGALALVMDGPNRQAPEEMAEAKGYVYIAAGDQEKWFVLPEAESIITLTRTDGNGKEIRNEIALFADGAYMKASTCENQDCVHQGIVTLENRTTRPLQNMILCLPNNVTLTLYSAEELAAMTVQE